MHVIDFSLRDVSHDITLQNMDDAAMQEMMSAYGREFNLWSNRKYL